MKKTARDLTDSDVKGYLIKSFPVRGKRWSFEWDYVNDSNTTIRITLTIGGKVSVHNVPVLSIAGYGHIGADAAKQTSDLPSLPGQSPDFICATEPLNVRVAPRYSSTPIVKGGNRNEGGGAIPGVRYKVREIEEAGEAVGGVAIWYRIDFNDIAGWVSGYYARPC